jgi:hypothetical protein
VPPSGNVSDEWSVLVLVRSGSDTGHTADEAYNLASTALDQAITAETTAEQALALAMTGGTNGQAGSAYAFQSFPLWHELHQRAGQHRGKQPAQRETLPRPRLAFLATARLRSTDRITRTIST